MLVLITNFMVDLGLFRIFIFIHFYFNGNKANDNVILNSWRICGGDKN